MSLEGFARAIASGGGGSVRLVVGTRLGDFEIDPTTGAAEDVKGAESSVIPSGADVARAALAALGVTVTLHTPVGSFGPVAVTL